ncbi:MAG: hypothetical protein ACR5KV_06120 [Wolbachia sp.]
MSSVHGTNNSGSGNGKPTRLLDCRENKEQDLLVKSWYNHVIYKQSATDKRTPGKSNVLFAEKNSVNIWRSFMVLIISFNNWIKFQWCMP